MMSLEDNTIIARATWNALERSGGSIESFPFKTEFYKKLDICLSGLTRRRNPVLALRSGLSE